MTPLLTYLIFSIAAGATGDALNYRGQKTWGHALRALEVLMLLCGGPIFGITIHDIVPYIVGYTFIRFALFSYIWNLVVPWVHWTYIGRVDPVDLVLRKLVFNDPDAKITGKVKTWHGILFARAVFLAAGVAMIVKEI